MPDFDAIIIGAGFLDAAGALTLDQARTIVGTLDRLHAPFWASPRFDADLAWRRAHERDLIADYLAAL